MAIIAGVTGREILDSSENPTVEAEVFLELKGIVQGISSGVRKQRLNLRAQNFKLTEIVAETAD